MVERERKKHVTWLACSTTIVANSPTVHTFGCTEISHAKMSDVTVNACITRWSPVTRRAVSLGVEA